MVSKTKDPETVITELKKLVVNVDYTEPTKPKKITTNKSAIWEMARNVEKHLTDDALSTEAPTRP